jgi:hypothetical protein
MQQPLDTSESTSRFIVLSHFTRLSAHVRYFSQLQHHSSGKCIWVTLNTASGPSGQMRLVLDPTNSYADLDELIMASKNEQELSLCRSNLGKTLHISFFDIELIQSNCIANTCRTGGLLPV